MIAGGGFKGSDRVRVVVLIGHEHDRVRSGEVEQGANQRFHRHPLVDAVGAKDYIKWRVERSKVLAPPVK